VIVINQIIIGGDTPVRGEEIIYIFIRGAVAPRFLRIIPGDYNDCMNFLREF
jgi:hypothetical protein